MQVVGDSKITLEDFYEVLFLGQKFKISEQVLSRVTDNYNFLKQYSKNKIIYGVNTGFGPMAQYRVEENSISQLQYNLIRSHAAGCGGSLSHLYAKSAMLARLGNLILAYSGVHVEVVELLRDFINKDICPNIPEHGSVGASGDLVQLAHLALNLIGEGEIIYKGEHKDAKEVFEKEGLKPITMHMREGLALCNGTSVMTGIGIVNVLYAKNLLNWAIVASSMINEIVKSFDDHFSDGLNQVKLHKGQLEVARAMQRLIKGSKLVRKRADYMYNGKINGEVFQDRVQEYYSLRCVPQVLGPVYETIMNTEQILIDEVNSVNDNPVVDMYNKNIYHGGNFHGDYVSFEMDKLKIATTKLTMLVERQLNYLCHDRINEILPPFGNLGKLGLNYGLQAAQFTATSTTAECQTLSFPMYVHSIPNNNDNQDIVSMGTNSALLAKKVIENSYQVLSIHFMAIAQAIDYLKIQNELSDYAKTVYSEIRSIFPVCVEDTPKYKEIKNLVEYFQNKRPGIIGESYNGSPVLKGVEGIHVKNIN
jgi:histidine ammonia-lyase